MRWPWSFNVKLSVTVLPMTILCWSGHLGVAQNTRSTATYRVFKQKLDAVAAIDTHDHLFPFDRLPCIETTPRGRGVNLAGLWHFSYFTRTHRLEPWKGGDFDAWWKVARHDFDNARANSFYQYQLPAFQDLYGVDFNHMTDEQAHDLDRRVFDHYKDQRWIYEVVTERANIELMLNDPFWARFAFTTAYPWEVLVFNVTPLVRGFHASEFGQPDDSPYEFAKKHGMFVDSFDDYLKVVERMFLEAKDRGAVCLKSTLAYQRTLSFDNVPKERAAKVFGRRQAALTKDDIKAFEDFIMWRLCELSAKYELPFQIHTGDARIQGSNPMLLVDLIAANGRTKFILFHGGYPWVSETSLIAMKYSNVWIDSCWLPTISYLMAKRAYHEWLDVVPSNKIMWGADCFHAEGIYGATEFTRRCLAEVLAERVDRGDLSEEYALRIGRQILRDNALELFPQLRSRLWKHTGKKLQPPLEALRTKTH